MVGEEKEFCRAESVKLMLLASASARQSVSGNFGLLSVVAAEMLQCAGGGGRGQSELMEDAILRGVV